MKNAVLEPPAKPCCSSSQSEKQSSKPCCGSAVTYQNPPLSRPYFDGSIKTKIGEILKVPTILSMADKWGSIKVRLAIKRNNYTVDPGLYAIGNPDQDSVVLVTANYKLSFDTLRKELTGIDAWILVLDTRGINVWCAAGKGTFGTSELVKRIEKSGLNQIVNHRQLVLPQLGAVGVSAHLVKKQSGFSVIYGPVRANDLPAFLVNNQQATPAMRQVRFNFFDRLLVMPVEIVQGFKYFLLTALAFFLVGGFTSGSGLFIWVAGLNAVMPLLLAYLAGTMLGPLLLPWLPGRSFSIKGVFAALIVFLTSVFTILSGSPPVEMAAWWFIMTAFASFLVMNFTGSSTYTSLSGVKKEMKIAIPIQASAAVAGILTWVAVRFHIF